MQTFDLACCAVENHPLRKNPAYIPRKFDLVCKRWSFLVGFTKKIEKTDTLGEFYGYWRNGSPSSSSSFYTFTFKIKFESVGEVNDDGKIAIRGRIIWRLEYFSKQNSEGELSRYESIVARRFGHKEDEIFEGSYSPSQDLICFQGVKISPYDYKETFGGTKLIALDTYRLRVIDGGRKITGVSKGNHSTWDNPIDCFAVNSHIKYKSNAKSARS